MKLIKGYIDYSKPIEPNHVVYFTANSTIKKNGELVMGAGNALACKKACPDAPKRFGNWIHSYCEFRILHIPYGEGFLGAFQTKLDWKEPTPLDLLTDSIDALDHFSRKSNNLTFHLPCPAIGYGGMQFETVVELLKVLPDNVLVYH